MESLTSGWTRSKRVAALADPAGGVIEQGSFEVQERRSESSESTFGSVHWPWRLSDFFWVVFWRIPAYLTA